MEAGRFESLALRTKEISRTRGEVLTQSPAANQKWKQVQRLESFAAPCCVCFSVLPTSSGAHLIPSSSLVELGLSGPHRTNPITTPLGGPASSQDTGGQASLEMSHSVHTRIYLPTLCKTWLSYLPGVSREVKLFAQNHIAS